MTPSTSSGQAPCPGVKGHGYINVPGAWYDLASRMGAVRAVVYWINDSLPPLDKLPDKEVECVNRLGGMVVAAENLLDLMQEDLDRLELQMKSA